MNSVNVTFESILSFALFVTNLALIVIAGLEVFSLNVLLDSRSVLEEGSFNFVEIDSDPLNPPHKKNSSKNPLLKRTLPLEMYPQNLHVQFPSSSLNMFVRTSFEKSQK